MNRASGLILSAGMPRSGSTLLYNLARLTLESILGDDSVLSCGWIDDIRTSPLGECTLMKLHDYEPDLASQASLIIYSYRDVRDAIASQQRKFHSKPTLSLTERYLEEYRLWTNVAHIKVRYESFDAPAQARFVKELAEYFGSKPVDSDFVVSQAESLRERGPSDSVRYDPLTLLHHGHVTNGQPGAWRNQLDTELVRAIESTYASWLADHGYGVD